MLDRYVAQVRLLLSVLPDIATETVFALKGGTAIASQPREACGAAARAGKLV